MQGRRKRQYAGILARPRTRPGEDSQPHRARLDFLDRPLTAGEPAPSTLPPQSTVEAIIGVYESMLADRSRRKRERRGRRPAKA